MMSAGVHSLTMSLGIKFLTQNLLGNTCKPHHSAANTSEGHQALKGGTADGVTPQPLTSSGSHLCTPELTSWA